MTLKCIWWRGYNPGARGVWSITLCKATETNERKHDVTGQSSNAYNYGRRNTVKNNNKREKREILTNYSL